MRTSAITLALAIGLAVLAGCRAEPLSRASAAAAPAAGALAFGDAFWNHWGDGRAELSGYELTIPRYGQLRQGTAVVIFVTETFSSSLRVKADPGKHRPADEFPVMKLNLVMDFPTGIYDYNLMTSAFVALAPVNGLPAGSVTKVSFSSQEWCGNVYSQILFDPGAARHTLHSYFDGEADRTERVAIPAGSLAGDALLLWARGLAAPALARGERREVSLVRSLRDARMRHRPAGLEKAWLSREAELRTIAVPAGRFRAEVWTARIEQGPTWTFLVEAAPPGRILQWESSNGEKARLLSSQRLKYWELNQRGGEAMLGKLGLRPRPARTP